MRDWIYRIVDVFPGPLRTVGRAVADLAYGVWDEIGGVFRTARAAWLILWANINAVVWSLHGYGIAVYTTARNIIVNTIPRHAQWAIDRAIGWAAAQLQWLRGQVYSSLGTLRDWASQALNAVKDFTQSVLDWAARELGEAWQAIMWLLDRVSALLTDPSRLVAWILGPLIGALIRWALDNAEAIADAAWARRGDISARTLTFWETIIRRIL